MQANTLRTPTNLVCHASINAPNKACSASRLAEHPSNPHSGRRPSLPMELIYEACCIFTKTSGQPFAMVLSGESHQGQVPRAAELLIDSQVYEARTRFAAK